jgi:hypothetical protein
MNYTTIILLGAAPAGLLFVFTVTVVVPRHRIRRRARALLAQHPGAELTSVYLALYSTWTWGKRREIDAKIAEMKAQGWTCLRGAEVSPLRKIRSWHSGLTLHFFRTHDSETSHIV